MKTKVTTRCGLGIIALLCFLLGVSSGHAQIVDWVYTYTDGQDLMDAAARSIVYGADSNLYSAGYLDRAGTRADLTVISVDPTSHERWVYTLDGLGPYSYDEATSVAYGEDGFIYAAGYTWPLNSYTTDFTVVSTNPYGGHRWLYSYNGAASNNDAANAIIAAEFWSTAVGYSTGTGSGKDFTVISLFNTNGQVLSNYRYNGAASYGDEAYAVTYDDNDFIYAAGYSIESGTDKDFTVISLSLTGTQRWVYTYDGAAGKDDIAYAIIYGRDGNLYVAGTSVESGTDKDLTVISLDTTGAFRWRYTHSSTNNEAASAIAFGDDYNLYVSGYKQDLIQNKNFLVASIDTSGTQRWIYTYNGSAGGADSASAIVYGDDGFIYAAGFTTGSGTKKDLTVISLDSAKTERWVYTYNGAADSIDIAQSIIYGGDGNLYTAGRSDGGKYTIISIDPALRPQIWVNPGYINVMIDSGATEQRTLKIANTGPQTSALEWNLGEKPPAAWLDEDSTGGILGGGDTVAISVTFSADNLIGGVYRDTIEITSNDPSNPLKDVPVQLTVRIPGIEEYPQVTDLEPCCLVRSTIFQKAIEMQFSNPSEQPLTIYLYDILGTRVYDKALLITPQQLSLNDPGIARLGSGIYFLAVSNRDYSYPVIKLIKF